MFVRTSTARRQRTRVRVYARTCRLVYVPCAYAHVYVPPGTTWGKRVFSLFLLEVFKIVNLEELPLIPFSVLHPSCHLLNHSSDNLAIRGF